MKTARSGILLVMACSVLAGARGSCGGEAPTEPLPQTMDPPVVDPNNPPPPPPPIACAGLDETQCLASASCEAVYSTQGFGCACAPCAPDTTCPACDCAAPERPEPVQTYEGCRDRDPCEGLDEMACVANPECVALYATTRCLAMPCPPDDPNCGRCGGGTAPQFAGCSHRPQECGPVCDIACPYGHQRDANGCELCACNPPPVGCEGLDEQSCLGHRECRPVYGASDADEAPCACPACEPGTMCPPCNCGGSGGARPAPPPPNDPPQTGYLYCETIRGCEGLDEMQCYATPGCTPRYEESVSGGAALIPCECTPCSMDDANCTCTCNDPQPPPPPPERRYAGCEQDDPCRSLDERSCVSNPSCVAEYATSSCGGEAPPSDGSDRFVPPCPQDDPDCQCTPETVFVGCHGRAPDQCRTDADCPNGYCEAFATCAGLNCPPPPPSQCVKVECNDGSELLCDALPPVCAPGETAAVRNNCWTCVDARSCGRPTTPPTEPTNPTDPDGH